MNKIKIQKIGAAIIKNKKLLVVKEFDWKKYGVPGGSLESGETDIECLKREIKEELCVSVKSNSFEYLGTFEDLVMNEPGKLVKIKFYKVELKEEPKKTDEIIDMYWFGKNDNPDELGPIDKNHLIPALVKRGLID